MGGDSHVVNIGQAVRESLGVNSEQELKEKLGQVEDPSGFDAQFYKNLPSDRACVIDGKLATTVGPGYIGETNRSIISVNLYSDALTSAKRITQRETGLSFAETVLDSGQAKGLLARYVLIKARAEHDLAMRKNIETEGATRSANVAHRINTRSSSAQEVVSLVVPKTTQGGERVPDWELGLLEKTIHDLQAARVVLGDIVHPSDDAHFKYNLDGIKYKTDRLSIMMADKAIADIRHDLKNTIIDSWSSLMMKHTPRFFVDADGNLSVDSKSQRWTPEHYKIAEAWPIFTTMLKGKTILDPFAGAGTLANLLASRQIPSRIYTTDLSYEGGLELDGLGKFYQPELNRKMWELLFDDLPSWYRPIHSLIDTPMPSDVRSLPFDDKSIDYIVTDPPYGRNCKGGCELLVESLGEMKRVAKEGCILLIPTDWVEQLEKKEPNIERLTHDVSRGSSSLATSYIFIPSNI